MNSIRDDSNWANFGGCSLPLEQHAIRPKAISSGQENIDYDLLYITLFHPTSMRYETGIGTIDSIITISLLISHLFIHKYVYTILQTVDNRCNLKLQNQRTHQ